MKLLFLWSDVLLYILLAAIAAFVISLAKNPQSRARWHGVFMSRLGMVSFIIILSYIAIGFTDSLHFRTSLDPIAGQQYSKTFYSNKVHSILDRMLGEMSQNTERTYSAPFSLKSYLKENIQDSKGRTFRDFPNLQHAGSHLQIGDSMIADIFWQSIIACLKGLLISSILIAAHLWYMRGKKSLLPWNTAYITLAMVITLLAWLLHVGNLYHILGTDMSGNDVLYKGFKGIRTGMLIGSLTTLIMMPIAIFLGIAAGYFKGWVDDIIQYLYTTLSSIPSLLLVASAVLLFQVWIDLNPDLFETSLEKGDTHFVALCFILGITSWASLCRLLRAETLKLSQLEYVQAAHAFGVSHIRTITRHILPNVVHLILITFILDFSALVLAEAVLSYIGIGVDASIISWGNMITSGSSELSREPAIWWNLTGAFIFMSILVLASNLFSDLVNDIFNPKTINAAQMHKDLANDPIRNN
ncbi:MAG: ABC transporter permease [Candidatus Endonucleobacter bathymodioli]|uniref:ABC transporter permease n=1 Tax=Candidatus Endonucleibacter bathymodioli TaxID=539814 RepID=A0AA90STW5_9GAMM|nr:ABC transporter permease [Candidatus Endonucleobacter bathymodioli]